MPAPTVSCAFETEFADSKTRLKNGSETENTDEVDSTLSDSVFEPVANAAEALTTLRAKPHAFLARSTASAAVAVGGFSIGGARPVRRRVCLVRLTYLATT